MLFFSSVVITTLSLKSPSRLIKSKRVGGSPESRLVSFHGGDRTAQNREARPACLPAGTLVWTPRSQVVSICSLVLGPHGLNFIEKQLKADLLSFAAPSTLKTDSPSKPFDGRGQHGIHLCFPRRRWAEENHGFPTPGDRNLPVHITEQQTKHPRGRARGSLASQPRTAGDQLGLWTPSPVLSQQRRAPTSDSQASLGKTTARRQHRQKDAYPKTVLPSIPSDLQGHSPHS